MELTLRIPSLWSASGRLSGRRWQRVFLFLVATLSSTVMLKVGPVQYLELIYFLQMAALLVVFGLRRFRATWYRLLLRIGMAYALFCVVGIILAAAALRFDFYYPYQPSPLNAPLAIAIVRSVELSASVFIMLWMADRFRHDPASIRFTMRVYFWTGVASAIYSIASWPLALLGIENLGMTSSHRFRGFYNEGGPWGLYLLSVILIGFGLHHLRWENTRKLLLAGAPLLLGLAMSGSKSALVAGGVLLLINTVAFGSALKRVTVAFALAGLLLFGVEALNFDAFLRAYAQTRAGYERLSHLHSRDGNFVVGRVAGAFIVPRMIAAHPYSGVGWGNYGLLRNTPEYRGAGAFSWENDQPGLGLIGYAAELGVPLTLYLSVLLLIPSFYLLRRKAPAYLVNLALLQPLVHLFGAQLNLTYPWVVTSFALGLACLAQPHEAHENAETRPPHLAHGLHPASST